MVEVEFIKNGFKFTSIQENDLATLEQWLKENNDKDDTCYSLDSQIFYRRFWEDYVTENECFIKIEKDNDILGVFKGRIELEDRKELFIWLYVTEKSMRNKGIGSEFVENIIEYFKDIYSIDTVKVGIVENNIEGMEFWRGNGFTFLRKAKNFFQNKDDENIDLIILER